MDLQELLKFAQENGGKLTIDFGTAEDKEVTVSASNGEGTAGHTRKLNKDTMTASKTGEDFDKEHAHEEKLGGATPELPSIAELYHNLEETKEEITVEVTGNEEEADSFVFPDNVTVLKGQRGYVDSAPEREEGRVEVVKSKLPKQALSYAKQVAQSFGYAPSEIRIFKANDGSYQVTDKNGVNIDRHKDVRESLDATATYGSDAPWYEKSFKDLDFRHPEDSEDQEANLINCYPKTVEDLSACLIGQAQTDIIQSPYGVQIHFPDSVTELLKLPYANFLTERGTLLTDVFNKMVNNGMPEDGSLAFVKALDAVWDMVRTDDVNSICDSFYKKHPDFGTTLALRNKAMEISSDLPAVITALVIANTVDTEEKYLAVEKNLDIVPRMHGRLVGKPYNKGNAYELVTALASYLPDFLNKVTEVALTYATLMDATIAPAIRGHVDALYAGLDLFYMSAIENILRSANNEFINSALPDYVEEKTNFDDELSAVITGKQLAGFQAFKEKLTYMGEYLAPFLVEQLLDVKYAPEDCEYEDEVEQLQKLLVMANAMEEEALEANGVLTHEDVTDSYAVYTRLTNFCRHLKVALDGDKVAPDVQEAVQEAFATLEELDAQIDSALVEDSPEVLAELEEKSAQQEVEARNVPLQARKEEQEAEKEVKKAEDTSTGKQLAEAMAEKAIIQAYEQGQPQSDILVCYNISAGKLYSILDSHGVARRGGKVSRVASRVKHIEDNKVALADLIDDYESGKVTLAQLYDKYDLYKNGLFYLLDKYNVPRRGRKAPK